MFALEISSCGILNAAHWNPSILVQQTQVGAYKLQFSLVIV